MISWLSVSTKSDLEHICKLIRLPKDEDQSTLRMESVEIGAVLPALRMSERKRIISISQSAPLHDVARLHQKLKDLMDSFLGIFSQIESGKEGIFERIRENLVEINKFICDLNLVFEQRSHASELASSIENFPILAATSQTFEPIYIYIGFETEALIESLKKIKYPDSLTTHESNNFRFNY